jgi:tetratricopeptide (TPR) repeat protein
MAERSYRMAIRVDPGFPPARANLGRRLYDRGAYDEAREQFERLTEVAPESIEGWLGLAESLARLGREDDADNALARARQRFGDTSELVLLVSRQMIRRGAFAEAETTLAPLTADTDRARGGVAWSWIAVSRLGQGNLRGAQDAANEALLVDPANPVARYALAASVPLARP